MFLVVLIGIIDFKPTSANATTKETILQVSASKKYAYRKTYFGDSKSKVKKVIKSKLINEEKNLLQYKSTALKMPCIISFSFVKGKLEVVLVSFTGVEKYDTWGKQKYLHNLLYKRLKKELNTKKSGFTSGYDSYDTISTLWSVGNRDVFLSVRTSDWDYETSASVFYQSRVGY